MRYEYQSDSARLTTGEYALLSQCSAGGELEVPFNTDAIHGKIGVTQVDYASWEYGDRRLRRQEYQKITDAFKRPREEINTIYNLIPAYHESHLFQIEMSGFFLFLHSRFVNQPVILKVQNAKTGDTPM